MRRSFPCPHCRQTVSLNATPGQLTRCRRCQSEVRVPLEMGETPRRAARCDACGREFETGTAPGKRVPCPDCGASVRVPLRVTAAREAGLIDEERVEPEHEDEHEHEHEQSAGEEQEGPDLATAGFVTACGMVTTTLALGLVVALLLADPPYNLLGVWLEGLPVGALTVGALAASGYVLSARRLSPDAAAGALPWLVATGVIGDYALGHLVTWWLLEPRQDGVLLGPLTFYDQSTRALCAVGKPLGSFGYLLRIAEVGGVTVGALLAFRWSRAQAQAFVERWFLHVPEPRADFSAELRRRR